MHSIFRILSTLIIWSFLMAEETTERGSIHYDPFQYSTVGKIGDHPFPTNPMNDRAIGYLLQGKAQAAISNYGNIINWDEHPMGIWNGFSYLPSVAFLAGIPGQKYSIHFLWEHVEYIVDEEGFPIYGIWESGDAYDEWFLEGDTNFVGILFDADRDDGRWYPDSISRRESKELFDGPYQYAVDHEFKKIALSTLGESDPNSTSARIGLIYPWALRPKLIQREDQFDFYNYGADLE